MRTYITDRIRLFFRKDKESYFRFYRILGFYPRNIHIYEQALLHKSSSIKSDKGRLINNERLEFLGDAILDAVVADIIYNKFEKQKEGFLTNTRSKIVQRDTLNKLAKEIGLDKLIKSSTRTSSHNSYMCGNAFEALIGAIYLDRGYEACKQFMEEKIIGKHINLEKIARKEVNFKSKFIEWSQKHKITISFELIEQFQDNDSNPVFQTEVLIEGLSGGTGIGYSKKESQQNAAQMALKKIKSSPEFIEEIYAVKASKEQIEEQPEENIEIETASEDTDTFDLLYEADSPELSPEEKEDIFEISESLEETQEEELITTGETSEETESACEILPESLFNENDKETPDTDENLPIKKDEE